MDNDAGHLQASQFELTSPKDALEPVRDRPTTKQEQTIDTKTDQEQ